MEWILALIVTMIAYYIGWWKGRLDLVKEAKQIQQDAITSVANSMVEIRFELEGGNINVYEVKSGLFLVSSPTVAELYKLLPERDNTKIYWANKQELEKLHNHESKPI